MPYTYLLRHIPTNTFYYGVVWKRGCDPKNFWKRYFTSSKKMVPLMRILFGDESFEFEIRRFFDDKTKAVEWESKVLRRMNVLEKPNIWLNRTNNKAILNIVQPVMSIEARCRLSTNRTGIKRSISTIEKMKATKKRKIDGGWRSPRLGVSLTDEHKIALRKPKKNVEKMRKPKSAEHTRKNRECRLGYKCVAYNTKWINDGKTEKYIDKNTTPPTGWKYGRVKRYA